MLLADKNNLLSLDNCNKQEIIDYLTEAWRTEDELFKSILKEESFYLNPDPLRNPLIFYLGHSAVFYLNKLVIVGLLSPKQRINSDYEQLYEIGVDPQTPQELNDAIASIKWHKVEALWAYRQRAYETIVDVIQQTPLSLPITPKSQWWAIIMGIEHQRIHIETSSMLIRQLPVDLVQKPEGWQYATSKGKLSTNEMIAIDGGALTLGKKDNDYLYGWDIDYGKKEVEVEPFLVSKYMTTNCEFLEFVEAGGYQNPDYWSPEGWQWKQLHNVGCPKFWLKRGDYYYYRLMFDEIELPLDFPVEVNHYEAIAFGNYYSQKSAKECGLMSEAQWHLASKKSNESINDYNLNGKYCSPHPVGSMPTSKSDTQLYDLRGNVWEWLTDIFQPLSGFQPHYLYEDYSVPFFDDRHYMLIGGSWATNGYEATPYYRNWFRPYFYQHAGFRIVSKL